MSLEPQGSLLADASFSEVDVNIIKVHVDDIESQTQSPDCNAVRRRSMHSLPADKTQGKEQTEQRGHLDRECHIQPEIKTKHTNHV